MQSPPVHKFQTVYFQKPGVLAAVQPFSTSTATKFIWQPGPGRWPWQRGMSHSSHQIGRTFLSIIHTTLPTSSVQDWAEGFAPFLAPS